MVTSFPTGEKKKKKICLLYYFTRAAKTKYPNLDSLNNRTFFSHSSRSWKSKIKVPVGVASLKPSLFDLQMSVFSLCPHKVFPLHTHIPDVYLYVPISFSYKDPCHIGLGPTLMASFYVNHPFNGPISKCSHSLRFWG